MPQLRVDGFTISLDGFGAGAHQSLENPLGMGGSSLHQWLVGTRTFQRTFGNEGGTTDINDDMAARGFRNVGAWIMGRNMFGPVRGPWPDGSWKGWWGDEPPYHCPVFVLSHYPRATRSRCKVGPCSISSRRASTKRFGVLAPRPAPKMSGSGAGSPRSSSFCAKG